MRTPTEAVVMMELASFAIAAYLSVELKRPHGFCQRSPAVPCRGLWLVVGRPGSLGASRVAGSGVVFLFVIKPKVTLGKRARS